MNMKARSIYIETSQEAAARKAVEVIEQIVKESISLRDKCHIALAGGTTPRTTYQLLANKAMNGQIPWDKLNFFFSDERNVPHDDIESNYGMAQRELFDKAPVNWSNVFPMPCDAGDLGAAAADYEKTIRRVVGGEDDDVDGKKDNKGNKKIPRFDLIMLGVGYDGHVASLFPDSPMLQEKTRLVAADLVPIIGRYRMTFTFPLIKAARNVLLLVTGDDKAEVVKKAIIGGDISLPAMKVRPSEGKLYIVLDQPAARLAIAEIQEKF